MRIKLPIMMTDALPVLARLAAGGFEAVFVGGCVRDTLLAKDITDVDIATSATPEQVMELFERTVPTGIQHGTVTVLVEGRAYEVTTYRQESAYEDHRRPESVAFIANLVGDLQRRDLTINAIALRADGTLVDPFGGVRDLQEGVIRCVGDAESRFNEDALRMLRAIRFMAEFDFRCSPATWKALLRRRALLKHIAMERVCTELDKMIGGSGPAIALYLLKKSRLLNETKIALEAWDIAGRHWHCGGSDALPYNGVAVFDSLPDRWAYLFVVMKAEPEAAVKTMEALRFPGNRSKEVAAVLQLDHAMQGAVLPAGGSEAFPEANEALRANWIRQVLHYGTAAAHSWLRIVETAQITSFAGSADRLSAYLNAVPASSLRDLDLNGKELAERLQQKPGPWTGEWLNRLLLEVALGQVENHKAALLAQAEKWKTEECWL